MTSYPAPRRQRRRAAATLAAALALLLLPTTATAQEEPAGVNFTFNGGGWGHGTGMSQYGARGQAQEGRTYDQILTYYFTDVRLARLRDTPAPGQIGSEGPIWVGLEQRLTHKDLKVWPLDPSPHHVTVSRDAQSIDILPNNTFSFDYTPDGCTFFVGATFWEAGSCSFDIEWNGWDELPGAIIDTTLLDDSSDCFVNGERCYTRGTMHIRPWSESGDVKGFHLVVEVDMEQYLYGLAEVPYSWEEEALKAQAVAGRSYAANKQALRGHPADSPTRQQVCWCQVYDTVSDQNYVGWGRVEQTWLDAVDATAGKVLYHPVVIAPASHQRAGEPIAVPTFYSSSTFGHTEHSEVAFRQPTGSTPPYLVGVPDPWSIKPSVDNPYAHWSKNLTSAELADALGMTDVTDVEIISWLRPDTPYQAAYQVKFSTTSGEPVIRKAFSLRSTLGLRSMQIVSIDKHGTGGPGLPPVQVGMQNPGNGLWSLRNADDTSQDFWYGIASDIPIMCDWNGDGLDTVGLYRASSGFMYLRDTNETAVAENSFYFGMPEDVPVCGDWDRNGIDTIGIYRPSDGRFYLSLANKTRVADIELVLAAPGTVPIAGDWNGDGFDTVGLWDPVTRNLSLTNSLEMPAIDVSYAYNAEATDRIVTGDWDGDGFDTVGVFRPEDLTFYLRDDYVMAGANHQIEFGEAGWNPVAGVWQAD